MAPFLFMLLGKFHRDSLKNACYTASKVVYGQIVTKLLHIFDHDLRGIYNFSYKGKKVLRLFDRVHVLLAMGLRTTLGKIWVFKVQSQI